MSGVLVLLLGSQTPSPPRPLLLRTAGRLRHCKNNKLSYLQSWARASEQDGSALRVWPGYSSDSGLNITLREYYKG